MTLDGRRGDSKSAFVALLLIALLVLSALACAQAGEVLTPEEATRRAQGPDSVDEGTDIEVETIEGLDVGDTAALTGQGFLINILDEPGGRLVANQERGATVTINDVAEVDGDLWYQITAPTGEGWVSVDNLEAVVDEPVVSEEGADTATDTEGEADAGPDENGIAVGDVVFLTGRGFLINILGEPAGNIRATQERGAQVEVLERSVVDGTTWYRIDAPTGEGWVAADNLTAEAP